MKNNNNRDMDQNMGLKDFSHSLCSLEITYIQIFGGRGGGVICANREVEIKNSFELNWSRLD